MSKFKKEPVSPIKPYDQLWMIQEGIHPPFVSIDKSVFVKTQKEKDALKVAKAMYKNS
jgi:hypothetical protein